MSCGFPIEVSGALRPCGKCQGCLRRRRRGWVGRMLAEASELGPSSFVTLTYESEPLSYLKESGIWIPTLDKSHARSWLRSVKRKATPRGLPFRFFMAGEYGSKEGRPHLHVILFGIGPTWAKDFEPCWKHGFQSWYDASPRAMAYVAKYCLKHGRDPELELMTSVTPGEPDRVTVPPFRRMSRNPSIGASLATKVAKQLATPGTPAALLEAEKSLAGEVRISKDRYPMDRTVKERLDKELRDVYAVDDVTRQLILRREPHEPTPQEIENAQLEHIRASHRKGARTKL